ncbi:Kazal-type serine protease inhibitor domain-containing protein 1 [Triplophysa tibetana]|uniref:Kazal-type serine protease inhibitor domain-containing protein 1 n=1 Tax=Triplophysa tibetana TaxID=1572043 RepID=A0A5A9NIB1_9TELE|nr:Kazal-type serine protease inhibitor domain-containing protein 1 [Triplophysa tibetana]
MVGVLAMLVMMLASVSQSFRLGRVDWQKSVLPGEGCPKKCHSERCPDLRQMQGCAGGLVRDQCGCCWECGNEEGQLCDPQPSSTFYGRCAEGLRCRTSGKNAGGEPHTVCVCSKQEALCGSDGKTYNNLCQLRAAKHKQGKGQMLTMVHHGPCKAKPVIALAPRDIITPKGSDVIFSCEVSSYPLASIQWRKEGDVVSFPADDSSMAVQARGRPRRFELTGWLQIRAVGPSDAGVYTCTARNAFGEVSASARLQVTHGGSHLSKDLRPIEKGEYRITDEEEVNEDDEDYEGRPSGHLYL